MKEVSLIAATFYGNRGAEGMLSTTIGKLRECYGPDLSFNVFTYYPKRDRELVNDPNVTMYSSTPAYLVTVLLPSALLFQIFRFFRLRVLHGLLPQSVQALARSCGLICLAGVSFVEGRSKFIPFNIATILPAMLLSVPVVKFAQAMGPFKSLPNRWAARLFLGRCRHIFTRGEKTHSYLKGLLSDKGNYQRADDVAFLFKREYCISTGTAGFEKQLAALIGHRKTDRIIVGICPSAVISKRAEADGWNYRQRMCELISGLVHRGYTVAMYPNATRGEDMDKPHNNDLPLLKTILESLGPDVGKHVFGFSNSMNAEQIHQIINACDVQAVSRFHAMVAALASAVPVMVIGWSHKYLEVMERFSQQDMVFDYKKGSVEPVISCIDQLVDERSERSVAIASALPAVQQLASKQIDYLVELLQGNA
jgi:polysaccharide pyruvyl transferase WcaK-like protein